MNNYSLKSKWKVGDDMMSEPGNSEVNILQLFTKIENKNCLSIYTRSALNNTRSQHLQMKTIQMDIRRV